MHRRALLKAIVALPVAATAAMLPNIAEAANNLIPLEDLYGSMRSQFREWGIKDRMKGHPLAFDPVFTEEELRAYVEMSLDWMNARLEGEEINGFLPGDPEQVVGDAIYTELQGEARDLWRDGLVWMAVTHAMFALTINFVRGEGDGVQVVAGDPDPGFQRFKEQAEEQHDAAFDAFVDQAETQYRPA